MEFTYPLQGKSFEVTSGFGERWGRKHKGIDLDASSGTRVVSAADGEVIKSDDTSDPNGYGGQILIKHNIDGKTFFSRYAHLRKRYVRPGEKVSKGEKIGESGGGDTDPNKGRSTGPHLHFELLDYGQNSIDPTPFLTGAGVLGAAATSSSSKEDDYDEKPKSEKNIIDKVMSGFMKGYAPVGYLSGLKGLTEPQNESDVSQPIMEEIERIKELLK